ncbi:hypothetical protein H2199_004994 [Coniosporium tulheliwenetii]|uniref:Uncharacterized protein n=1 Tax=Coniosporium tulheliwenetii TaxID=3383036 RepID=A0ACC2Z248_9PEZI|nr:hypothetical protein H2199_004994 [Cladosporium sp. JES 115]
MLMPLPVFSQQIPAEPGQGQTFRPFFTGPPTAAPVLAYGSPVVASPQVSNVNIKRSASQTPLVGESPAKKQSKWNKDDDVIITELRGSGMKWEDISKRFPGRSAMSCRLRYQNYIERRNEWDDEKKNKLARLYERFKKEMWEGIAKEMGVPWRTAEAMHWQLGELQMAERANVPLFQMATSSTNPQASAPPPAIVSHHGLGYPLPQNQPVQPQAQPRPPAGRRNSAASGGRRRADSAKTNALPSTLPAVLETPASQRASTAPTSTSQVGLDDPVSASGPFQPELKQERSSTSPSQQYRPLQPAEATGTDTSEEEGRRQ